MSIVGEKTRYHLLTPRSSAVEVIVAIPLMIRRIDQPPSVT